MLLIIVYNKNLDKVISKFGMQNREIYHEESIRKIESVFLDNGYDLQMIDGNLDMFDQLRRLMKNEDDIPFVFNLAYGIQGEDRYSHIPSILEMLGLPYLGSGPLGHTMALDKVISKTMMKSHRIPTPWFRVINSEDDINQQIEYPVVIKPSMESDSYGLKIAHDKEELGREMAALHEELPQILFVEKFIKGREFGLSLMGNGNEIECFPLTEIDLEAPEQMYTIDNKRNVREKKIPGDLSLEAIGEMEAKAKQLFQILRLKDYARADLRMDEKGNYYFLEINSMASLGPSGSFAAAAGAGGYTFDEMILKLLDTGIKKYFGKHQKLKVDYESRRNRNGA